MKEYFIAVLYYKTKSQFNADSTIGHEKMYMAVADGSRITPYIFDAHLFKTYESAISSIKDSNVLVLRNDVYGSVEKIQASRSVELFETKQ